MNWKSLAQIGAQTSTIDHSQTSTIVCVSNVTANNLSGESLDSYYEHNI